MSAESEGWYAYEFHETKVTQGTVFLASGFNYLPDRLYIVLNPECDLENGKSDYINLVAEGDLTAAVEDLVSGLSLKSEHWSGLELSKTLYDNISKRLRSHINGQLGARWFFIPADNKADGVPLTVFDFQQLHTIDSSSFLELIGRHPIARKAILRSPFKESLVTRVYSYLTRVGTEDGYKGDLCDSIMIAAGFRLPAPKQLSRTSDSSVGGRNQPAD